MERYRKFAAFFTAALFLASFTVASQAKAESEVKALINEVEALALGIEAYVYAYPLVTMEYTRRGPLLPLSNARWLDQCVPGSGQAHDGDWSDYTVSQRNDLKTNPDGSVDIYIQNESPGKDKESNWLPAPKDQFILMMRLYWPQDKPPSILDGSWKIPGVNEV